MKLPKARISQIIERDLERELLIYDLTTNKAYLLNETLKIVFQACGGEFTFAELKAAHHLTDEVIYLAFDTLRKQNLLAENEVYVSPFAGLSRRAAIKKAGLSSMIALPVIFALTAPTAAHAASGTRANCQPCTQNTDCASGRCIQSSAPGGRICSVGAQNIAAPAQSSIEAMQPFICDAYGSQYCCSGEARFTSSTRCTCNG